MYYTTSRGRVVFVVVLTGIGVCSGHSGAFVGDVAASRARVEEFRVDNIGVRAAASNASAAQRGAAGQHTMLALLEGMVRPLGVGGVSQINGGVQHQGAGMLDDLEGLYNEAKASHQK